MDKLQQLLDKRAKLFESMKALVDKGEESWNAEAKAKYEAMEKDFDALTAQIEAMQKMKDFEDKLNNPLREPLTGEPQSKDVKTDDYKAAFEAFVKGKLTPEFKATLNTGIDSEGGYIVPVEYQKKVLEKLIEISRTRAISRVITTKSDKKIPIGGELPTFSWIEETGAYGETGTDFSQATLNAYKLGGIIKVSEELLQDSFINLEDYLATLIARGIAQSEGEAFAVGDGNNKPTGYMSLNANITLSGTDSIAADELIDIYYSLKSPYRSSAYWRMNDATLKAIRKLKDGNGNYIYAPALVAGERDAILGRPIELDPFVSPLGAGNKVICFGDFNYYYISDRGNITMQKLTELFAANGLVGFRVSKKVDAKPILAEAFTIAKNANS
jgi:HK97 family phage major capsid protein